MSNNDARPKRFPVTKYRVDSEMSGELFELSSSSRTLPDGRYRFVWTLAPGKRGPGEHYHETETETFEVVSGTLRIWIEGVPKDYVSGDRVSLAPGVGHRFLNPGSVPLVANVTLDGSRMEDTFAPLAVATHGRKPTLADFARMIMVLGSAWPSTPVSRAEKATMVLLARVLGWFGVKAYPPVHGWDAVETPAVAA